MAISKFLILSFLLISWTPSFSLLQLVGYFGAPFLVIVALVHRWLVLSNFDLKFFTITTAIAFLCSVPYSDTGLLNPFLGIVTYSTLMVLVIRFPRSPEPLIPFLLNSVAWMSIFQFCVGTVQLVTGIGGVTFEEGNNGDLFQGTILANSHLCSMKMLYQGTLLLYMQIHMSINKIPYDKPLLLRVGTVLALLGAVLASFLAGLVLFVVSVGSYLGINAVRKATRINPRIVMAAVGAIFLLGTAGLFFVWVQPDNFKELTSAFEQFANEGFANRDRFQKFLVFQESISDILMDNPVNAVVGIGLGRFSSRAAMILSGGYLTNHPAWIPISRSFETTTHIYENWNPEIVKRFGNSTMSMPTSTAQSVLIEFGILGTVLFGWYFWYCARRAALMLKNSPGLEKTMHGGLLKLMPLLLVGTFILTFTDIWLEFSSFSIFLYLLISLALSSKPEEPQFERRQVRMF